MKTVRFIWTELISLLVDDGFLAVAALVAIGITWLVTRTSLGAGNIVGWLLFALLLVSVVISSRRAVDRHVRS